LIDIQSLSWVFTNPQTSAGAATLGLSTSSHQSVKERNGGYVARSDSRFEQIRPHADKHASEKFAGKIRGKEYDA
jgi:hypothetical protein